jgi:tRNA nucleotidyltransferase/poly(A) polymerase
MQMYKVGGCVRDDLLGLRSNDIDFSVVLEGNEGPFLGADPFRKMKYELEAMGFEIFLSIPEHLTIRARFPKADEIITMKFVSGPPRTMDISGFKGMTADFVLARKEGAYTDGRRPDHVEPGTLLDDLGRRDFTINAIAKAPDGSLIDPFNGQADLSNRLIRTVGDPFERLSEDALRAVRALRFALTKGMRIEGELEKVLLFNSEIHDAVAFNISDERISEELSKMFRYDSLEAMFLLHKYPALTGAMFTGKVSLDTTLKTRGRGK